ncbi:suppressor of fused domain protein [Hirschia litorea]|uniref:Suppressor of fused domain protein n=1 Tax=Hirschia litorea TaxID=1199156 RepID=A0ABW2ILX6_9PROT
MNIWGPETDFGMSTDDMRDALDLHLARHIGEFQTVFTDEDGWAGNSSEDGVPVDVLVVLPEGERKFAYVSSLGCSFVPLSSAHYREHNIVRRVEFVLAAQQNGNEEEDISALNLAANTVRQFAKIVHLSGVAVEEGETVTFSETPRPVFDDAGFAGFGFVKPQLPNPGFGHMHLVDAEVNSDIHFIAPIPLFKNEMELAAEIGPEAFCAALLKAGVTEMIDLKRQSIAGPPAETVEVKTISRGQMLWAKVLSWVGIK